jgi:hypothetical protein
MYNCQIHASHYHRDLVYFHIYYDSQIDNKQAQAYLKVAVDGSTSLMHNPAPGLAKSRGIQRQSPTSLPFCMLCCHLQCFRKEICL